MNIHQISQAITYGDAVSNDVFAIDKLLKENGYSSWIYAEYFRDSRIKKLVAPINNLADKIKKDDIVIYHLCIGTELTYWFEKLNCVKILIYHNITPHKYFLKYDKNMADMTRFGRLSVSDLTDSVDCVFADSEFNKQELINMGYKCVGIMPIIINFEDYRKAPDKKVINKYNDGKVNILFVGRLAPNKRQEDVILAFDYYKKNINENSRLILVGSNSIPVYVDKIKELPKQLGLKDVVFTGHVTFEELLGYYSVADLFLCMSEHEGFCVPLLECMYFNVPIVAFGTTAIPDTLGDSGIIFYKKDFSRIGELLDIIVKDTAVRNHILEKQRKRFENFESSKVKKKFIEIIKKLV